MNEKKAINTILTFCPLCGRKHEVHIINNQMEMLVKEELIKYYGTEYYCANTEESYVPSKIMDSNLLSAKDAYREKHGLLTSKEIKSIRDIYGVTQLEYAQLLGWGDITITRYESKSIQDSTFDSIMRMTKNDPSFVLQELEKNKEYFSTERYEELRDITKKKINSSEYQLFIVQHHLKAFYSRYEDESIFNGYKKLDIEKTNSVIGYFSKFLNNIYKPQLSWMLWFSDFYNFKYHGTSITGLVYYKKSNTTYPLCFNEILQLPSIIVEEEFIDEKYCIDRIKVNDDISISSFTSIEISILNKIVKYFKTNEISAFTKMVSNIIPEAEPIPYTIVENNKVTENVFDILN